MLEYGLSSRIGRTLEKSGCSAIGFDSMTVAQVATTVKERVVNELGALYKTEDIAFERMVIGFLNIMRSNGAFNDSVFGAFTNDVGNVSWLANGTKNGRRWLPGLRSGRNTPRFIYEPVERAKRLYAFDLVTHSKYTDWIQSCIDEFFIGEEVFDAIGKLIFGELVKLGIVVPMPSPPGYTVWALDKQKAMISTHVKQLVCEECGSMISVTEENLGNMGRCPLPDQ
jgi:DEAD/DEAH box helicase domain-containing protein